MGSTGGKNGGRSCWVLEGTLCGGEIQGNFMQKLANCTPCEFYKQVQQQEGDAFVAPRDMLRRLR